MLVLGLIAIMGAVLLAVTRWMDRRWEQVGSYRQPERRCLPIIDVGPPIFDVCDWLDGARTLRSRS